MSDETPIPTPTDAELDALLGGEDGRGGPELRIAIEVDGIRYGNVFQMPTGFPVVFSNEEAVVFDLARQVGMATAQTIYDHFVKDMA